jgi:hypothetical protein
VQSIEVDEARAKKARRDMQREPKHDYRGFALASLLQRMQGKRGTVELFRNVCVYATVFIDSKRMEYARGKVLFL